MKKRGDIMRLLLIVATVMLLGACASMGRPDGGPKDEIPPEYVRSNPEPGALNFDKDRISITFNENIKVEDVMNKVVVSPVQKSTPRVIANGKQLNVTFQDTLIPDVTYTIDFSDAIRDLNEGNILDGFAFDFSTGATRDSLVISGMLFEASNLEPAQGMIVGVYSNLEDSAITTLPFERIAKTNQYGQFVIRNLAPGSYNLFAVNDMNRDYHWDRSEDVAFYGEPITPSVEHIEVRDTLRASDGRDSIVVRGGVKYLPNDLLLTWFNENYKSQYLKNNARVDSTRIVLEFGAPSDTLPVLRFLNSMAEGKELTEVALVEHSAMRDTVTYWLRDPEIISTDTLLIETRYLKTDSLDQLSWTTDTLKYITKAQPKTQEKKKKKKNEEKGDSLRDSLPQLTFMTFSMASRGNQDVYRPLRFTASQPIDTIIASGLHLEIQHDTIWEELPAPTLVRDSINRLLEYSLHYQWEPEAKYRFTADSASIVGIYNEWIKPIQNEFTVKSLDEYSSIAFVLSGYDPEDQVVVQILNSSDKPVRTQIARDGRVKFEYLDPSTYYARAFIDRNGNGQWDTGNVSSKTQPDDVFYYPKKLVLKKNWDMEQSWNLTEMPIDRQKPNDIKKNKPKTKEKTPKNTNDDEEEEEDEYYTPGSMRGSSSNRGNSSGRNNYGGGGLRTTRNY